MSSCTSERAFVTLEVTRDGIHQAMRARVKASKTDRLICQATPSVDLRYRRCDWLVYERIALEGRSRVDIEAAREPGPSPSCSPRGEKIEFRSNK